MKENEKSLYSRLGVSSQKEDVHDAIRQLDKGLFPEAFCKIVKDVANRNDYCSIFHSDGAGTKASLAYMYYKETGNVSVFKGLAQDASVMNIDDIICVGALDGLYLSNTLGRNSRFISGKIISVIIKEYEEFCKRLTSLGIDITFCGGETADLPDLVKTLVVDASVFATMKKNEVIDTTQIQPSDVIIGLASEGKASYEESFNSGIGSNGLTLARHGTLSHDYYDKYPECYDQNREDNLSFFGKWKLTDKINKLNLTMGEALLSPTRSYAPLLRDVLKHFRSQIHAIIHATGGGQTKLLNFGKGIKFIKNNMFKIPTIFEIIQESSKTPWKEMYQIFNMGHRMEIICDESITSEIKAIAKKFNIETKIIGHCEKGEQGKRNSLQLSTEFDTFNYEKIH